MSYDVKIAGIKLPALGYDWQIKAGALPPIQGWIVPKSVADEIASKYLGKEIELQLDKVTIKRVYVLGITAAQLDPLPAPELRTVLLTDVRWYWTRGWLVRDINVRRKTADSNFLGAEVPIDAQTPVVSIRYASWTLDPASGQPFIYQAFLKNVLDYSASAPPSPAPKISWVVDPANFYQGMGRTVEEVMLDDSLPAGLARAVAGFPGRTLIPDRNGVIHVSDAGLGSEITTISALDPDHPIAGGGHMAIVDMAAHRPKKFIVKFTPEYEVMFWIDNQASDALPDDPFCYQMVRIPDKQLKVSTALPGQAQVTRNLAQGSIGRMTDVFTSWKTPTDGGRKVPALTEDIVRKNFLGPWLDMNYVLRSVPDPDSVWAARIRETKRSFRQLLQVNPIFWDRVLSAVTRRASVIDQATGTRAESPVFSGFALRPKVRWFAAGVKKTGYNVRGFGADVNGKDDGVSAKTQKIGTGSPNQPAPCRVILEDESQGILRLEWEVPSDGLYAAIAPSQIENDPTLNPKDNPVNLALRWENQALVQRWKMATILSCIPAAPNSDQRLWQLEVTQEQAAEYLTVKLPGKALGPDKVLRVGPHAATARFAWSDDPAAQLQILAAFGCGSGSVKPKVADPKATKPPTISPVNIETELRPLAKARAGAELASMLDHYEGELRVPMNDKTAALLPIGSLHMVTFRVTEDASLVILNASGESPQIDVMALLPNSARAKLLREVEID